jgi:hypothetical protein
MNDFLLQRLDAIGQSPKRHPDAVALIGLGSVELEQERPYLAQLGYGTGKARVCVTAIRQPG